MSMSEVHMDFPYVFAIVGLWAITVAMVWGCERLLGARP
jgi:hypothetical protein